MKPTVSRVLHYPALLVKTVPTLDGFRHHFPSRDAFKAFAETLLRDGSATIATATTITGGDDLGSFGVVVRLPSKTFAVCLAFHEWMRDTAQEASALQLELTGAGGELEGMNMLVFEVSASEMGRA